MGMKRFRIAEESMRPSLSPGDEVVATDSRTPAIGDVVVFPHPGREDFWLIKRVVIPPDRVDQDHVWVRSDNRGATRADSRTLGPIPIDTAMTRVERFDTDTFVQACELLAEEDESLASVIERHGVPEFWHRPTGFPTLVLLILEQQVSLESGAAMYRRLDETTGDVTPETILTMGADGLRAMGVTRQKTEYLLTLAGRIEDGSFDIENLDSMPVEEARDALTSLKGIGPWTADAYLLSAVRHIDMWPVGDRALQVGVGEVLGMTATPDEEELELIGEPWRPIRAAAARITWHSYLTERGRVEPPDPTLVRALRDDA